MIILGISGADYSDRYRLQPIILTIGLITRIAVISVQLYYTPTSIAPLTSFEF